MSSTSETSRDAGLVEQASAKVSDAASTAQEKAGELTTKGKSRVADQIDQRTTDAGSQARSMADGVRQSTEQMRSQGNTAAANVAEQAATQIERLASYLEQTSGNDIMRDVENFARRRPWLIAGCGLIAGIATARFLKASSARRYETYDGRRRLPQATGFAYVGTSAYGSQYGTTEAGSPYGAERRGLDDGTAPLARDPAAVDPFTDRPLGPEG
jgi:hypothetical protein